MISRLLKIEQTQLSVEKLEFSIDVKGFYIQSKIMKIVINLIIEEQV